MTGRGRIPPHHALQMREPVLSARALNRAMLTRQLLLERSDLPVPGALEQVGGLQTQYAPSGYVGLWSRLHGFRRAALTEALEARQAVQGTLMRATIHMVSAADFPLLAAGTRASRQAWWLRVQRGMLEDLDMAAVAARVRELLADGPRRSDALVDALAHEGYPRMAWSSVGHWLDLVRVPPSGTWERRRADLYGLADGELDPAGIPERTGLERLVRRYLGGFGPARPTDIASWAGLPVAVLGPVLDDRALGLRRFRDERGRVLVDLPDAPLPDPATPAPVRLLPTWEPILLAHARRADVLPERFRSRIFSTKTPHSVPTFIVDGAVAGTWRYEGGRVVTEALIDLPATVRRELDREAESLAAFYAE